MIVLDASAAFELLLGTAVGKDLGLRIEAMDQTLHAPHLLDIEVAHSIRRYSVAGGLDAARGRAALDALATLRLFRYPHFALLPRIWALRANITAYDATYVALAESLGALLITRDRRLAGTAGHHARIELI